MKQNHTIIGQSTNEGEMFAFELNQEESENVDQIIPELMNVITLENMIEALKREGYTDIKHLDDDMRFLPCPDDIIKNIPARKKFRRIAREAIIEINKKELEGKQSIINKIKEKEEKANNPEQISTDFTPHESTLTLAKINELYGQNFKGECGMILDNDYNYKSYYTILDKINNLNKQWKGNIKLTSSTITKSVGNNLDLIQKKKLLRDIQSGKYENIALKFKIVSILNKQIIIQSADQKLMFHSSFEVPKNLQEIWIFSLNSTYGKQIKLGW